MKIQEKSNILNNRIEKFRKIQEPIRAELTIQSELNSLQNEVSGYMDDIKSADEIVEDIKARISKFISDLKDAGDDASIAKEEIDKIADELKGIGIDPTQGLGGLAWDMALDSADMVIRDSRNIINAIKGL